MLVRQSVHKHLFQILINVQSHCVDKAQNGTKVDKLTVTMADGGRRKRVKCGGSKEATHLGPCIQPCFFKICPDPLHPVYIQKCSGLHCNVKRNFSFQYKKMEKIMVLFFDFVKKDSVLIDDVSNMGSSKKSCSKGILESCGLPGAKRIFAMEY